MLTQQSWWWGILLLRNKGKNSTIGLPHLNLPIHSFSINYCILKWAQPIIVQHFSKMLLLNQWQKTHSYTHCACIYFFLGHPSLKIFPPPNFLHAISTISHWLSRTFHLREVGMFTKEWCGGDHKHWAKSKAISCEARIYFQFWRV